MALSKRSGFVLSRRSFMRSTAFGAALVTFSRLRPAPAQAAVAIPAPELQVLTAGDAQIMTAIGGRMVFTGDPSMPAFANTHAIQTIDRSLLQLDPSIQRQLPWLLRGFEYGPLLQLKLTTFTAMPADEQDVYLQGWASGGEARMLAFRALKNLSMLGYYAQDDTWKGIHYDGPWVVERQASSDKLQAR